MRICTVSLITVSSPLGMLYQEGIERPDGTWLARGYSHLSETVDEGETPLEAAVRGLLEEVGLSINAERLTSTGTKEEVKISASTGELTKYTFYCFSVEITEEEAYTIPMRVVEKKGVLILTWKCPSC